jgi:hypothetical protein
MLVMWLFKQFMEELLQLNAIAKRSSELRTIEVKSIFVQLYQKAKSRAIDAFSLHCFTV